MKTIRIEGLEDLGRAAAELLAALPEGRKVIAFEGPMGAGKTTLIAELCRQLGTGDVANSPTFSIVNEYEVPGRESPDDRIYHFDFYRLESEAEALDIGAEDYFASGSFCLLEWGGNVEGILPDDTLVVRIEPEAGGGRVVSLFRC